MRRSLRQRDSTNVSKIILLRHLASRAIVISTATVVITRSTVAGKGRRVKIEYDPETDALYIQVREVDVGDNIDIEDGVTVDLDADRHIVGLEILDASKRLAAPDLSSIIIQKFPLDPTSL